MQNYLPKWWHWLIGILLVLISFKYIHGISNHEYWSLPRPTIYYGLLTPFILAFCDSSIVKVENKFHLPALLLSIVFAQFVSIGERYYTFHEWNLCFDSKIGIILWLLQSLCYGFVFYKIIIAIFFLLDNKGEYVEKKLNIKYIFWVFIAIRILFFVAFYPCIFDFDAAFSLQTFLDSNSAKCDHHPFFVQTLQTLFFTIGKLIGHRSVGMAILSLLSIAFGSLVLTYGSTLINNSPITLTKKKVIIGLYIFAPIFPYLSLFITKDGFFSYAFLLYIFTLYELYISNTTCLSKGRFVFIHALSIILVCLTRHQGIYLVIIEVFTLLFCYRYQWRKIIRISFVPIVLVLFYSIWLLPALDIEPGGKQEMYGTFFQQTAYCLKQYPNDVSLEEKENINRVLSLDSITLKYIDSKTDPVKKTYRFNPTYGSKFRHIDREYEFEAICKYMKSWFYMGLRHPLTYIKASSTIFLGFFYNDELPLISPYTRWASNTKFNSNDINFWHEERLSEYYWNHEFGWVLIPIVNIIIGIPYYNWIAMVLLSIIFYKKKKEKIVTAMPIFLSLCLLFICPIVDGRYIYPIVVSIPTLFILSLNTNNSINKLDSSVYLNSKSVI